MRKNNIHIKEEIEGETLSGTTHHLVKILKPILAKQFLHLLDKCFRKSHKYHKIFGHNNVKISYSCMDNMTSIISSHNKKVTKTNDNETNGKTCNCRNKSKCPVDNKCLTNKNVFKAEIKPNNMP